MFHREKQPFIKLISIALQFEDRLHRWDSLHKMLVIHDLNTLYATLCHTLYYLSITLQRVEERERGDY